MPLKRPTCLQRATLLNGKLYFFLLTTIAVCLPLSPFVLSMSQMWLGLYWLYEGDFKAKWQRLKTKRTLSLLLLLPLLHLLWLLNTSDFDWALYNLTIKVPLLTLPFLLATSKPLSAEQLKKLLYYFVWAVGIGTLIAMGVKMGIGNIQTDDTRSISIIISHIRFALMVVLAIAFLALRLIQNWQTLKPLSRLLHLAGILWFIFFLLILKVLISWIILLALSLYFFWHFQKKLRSSVRLPLFFMVLALLAYISIQSIQVYHDYQGKPIDFNNLPQKTAAGAKYKHNKKSKAKENGYYVHLNIAQKELRQAWKERSAVNLNQKNAKGYSSYATLIRYMTSKGLRKDAEGLAQLSDEDIKAIEQGIPNVIYLNKGPVYIKFYEAIWEIERYKMGYKADGKSIVMRLEFLKASFHLWQEHFWWGTGTGDLEKDYAATYQKIETRLSPAYQHMAHNQFLLFYVSFGFIGGTLALWSLLGPFILTRHKSVLLISFSLLIFVSMLTEDTLMTQAGVSFYSFFYPLLLLHNNTINKW